MKRIVITGLVVASIHLAVTSFLFGYAMRHFDEYGRLPEPPLYATACRALLVLSQPSGILWRPLWQRLDAPTWVLQGSDAVVWSLILTPMVNIRYLRRRKRKSDNQELESIVA